MTSLHDDRLIWAFTSNGAYTTKSAYESLLIGRYDSGFPWKEVWRYEGPQRVRCLLWMICRNGLKTNVRRRRCGLAGDDSCAVCGVHTETDIHLLCDCQDVKVVWRIFFPRTLSRDFWEMSLDEWLKDNLGSGQVLLIGCCSVLAFGPYGTTKIRRLSIKGLSFLETLSVTLYSCKRKLWVPLLLNRIGQEIT